MSVIELQSSTVQIFISKLWRPRQINSDKRDVADADTTYNFHKRLKKAEFISCKVHSSLRPL